MIYGGVYMVAYVFIIVILCVGVFLEEGWGVPPSLESFH
jgi:hypothetical protein